MVAGMKSVIRELSCMSTVLVGYTEQRTPVVVNGVGASNSSFLVVLTLCEHLLLFSHVQFYGSGAATGTSVHGSMLYN